MDDRDIYELMSKFTVGVNASLADLRVQLQEVATKIDERHVMYEEKISGVREDMDAAFKRLRKLENAHNRNAFLTSAATSVFTAVATAAAIRLIVG